MRWIREQESTYLLNKLKEVRKKSKDCPQREMYERTARKQARESWDANSTPSGGGVLLLHLKQLFLITGMVITNYTVCAK